MENRRHNTSPHIFQPDAGSILIKEPGIYHIQAGIHVLFAERDTLTASLDLEINKSINNLAKYSDYNF